MKTILVAEHDGATSWALEQVLGEVDRWTVTTVPTGAALLEALASVRPDLILLTVYLPGLDGVQVYRLLRERVGMEDIPVLFVTTDPERVRDADLDGNFSILPKPFSIDNLIARVAEMLGEPKPEI